MSFYRDYAEGVLYIIIGIILLVLFSPIILISWFIASIDTKSNGFLLKSCIGKNSQSFKMKIIYNIKLGYKIVLDNTEELVYYIQKYLY